MGERGWGRESGSERDESEERMKVGTKKVEGSFSNISLFRTFLSLSPLQRANRTLADFVKV